MPKISIIVPVYNAEKYLTSTLDSVLSQTFTDLEVLCVDDGSTDKSKQILKRYEKQDARLKVFRQKNGGGSAARNLGLRHASGEYVMFLDSDDLYEMDIINQAYGRAIETGADIVYYNFARFVGKPSKMAVVNKVVPTGELGYFTKDTYADRFFNDFAIITWNKLIKRSVIVDNNLKFNTKLSHNHDVDFSVRLMLAAESYYWLNKVGYYYRYNDTGLTATKISDPTNVLKILIRLNTLIASKYAALKPSFDNYVADMIVGTAFKYSSDTGKLREVFEFSHDVVVPEIGLDSASESTGIYKLVESGNYEMASRLINSPKRKIRRYVRDLYNATQLFLTRFTV